jgi:hypothetical protein
MVTTGVFYRRAWKAVILPLSALVTFALFAALTSRPTSASSAHSGTKIIVVRPVTKAGLPAAGYKVVNDNSGTLTCGSYGYRLDASVVSVSGNVASCFPTYQGAIAAWKDGTNPAANTVLVLRNPFSHTLYRLKATTIKPVGRAATPTPFGLVVNTGARFTVHFGGTWNMLAGHPKLRDTYTSTNGNAVWAQSGYGIDKKSGPFWLVRVASPSGKPVLRIVKTAYFVGTAN